MTPSNCTPTPHPDIQKQLEKQGPLPNEELQPAKQKYPKGQSKHALSDEEL
jgi:hypothetical protein